MGLFDIWNDWRSGAYSPKGYEWGAQETDVDVGNLNTAGGVKKKSFRETMMKNNQWGNQNPYKEADNSLSRKEKLIKAYTPNQNNFFSKIAESSKEKNTYIDAQGNKRNRTTGKIITTQDASKTPNLYKDKIMQGGAGVKQAEDLSFMHKLSNMAGVDFDKAAASWKDKGGFEGLMANPAFTMGLAFMQAGAEGKTLGQGALDNVMKAAGISSHYKKIIKERKQAPIQATSSDIAEVKSLLETMNVSDPSMIEKFIGKIKGKNVQQMFDISAEDIAIELQKEMKRMSDENPNPDKPLVFDTRLKLKILKRLLRSGKFKKKGGTFFTQATLESDVGGSFPEPKAQGGPVQAGKPYVVGEEGPEVIIPRSDGNVLSNDDSQIYAMLLAANPQLQKVSKIRAEKILRNRFPEYFE